MKVTLRANLRAILFAIVFPSIVTLLYFVVLADQPAPIQQATYSVLKVIQFAFPVVWVFVIVGKKFRWSGPRRKVSRWASDSVYWWRARCWRSPCSG
jgi:hypothetical protein